MARETINGISVPIPGTGEPADFVGDLRQIATDLSASIEAGVAVEATRSRRLAPLPGAASSGNVQVGERSVLVAGSGQHNAFPGMAVLADGTVLIVWRQASNHEPTTVGHLRARRYQPNGTAITVDPYVILSDTLDLRDPMLTVLPDGRIVVQYFKHDATATTIAGVFLAVSSDDGATFTEQGKVPFTWDTLAASSGRMVVAPNGDWLVAAYGRTSATFQHIRLMRSADEGQTWTGEITVAEGQAESRNYVEPVIGLLTDGQTLMCLIRVSDSDGSNPAIYRTTSTDNGATWTPETSVITAAGGRPAWTTLSNGAVVLCHRATVAPNAMQVRTSYDNGLTWTSAKQLGATPANQGTYAQPVEAAEGIIAVAYGIEASTTSSSLYLGYLANGYGFSPLGDAFPADAAIFKGAAEAGIVGGAATLDHHFGWPVIKHPATGATQAGFAFRVPPTWNKYDITLVWTSMAAPTGNVQFRHDYNQAGAGDTLASTAGAVETVAAGASGLVVETVMAAGVTRTKEFVRVKPTRLGDDALDTEPGAIGVIGVRLTRVR